MRNNNAVTTIDEVIAPVRNDINLQAGNEEFVGRLYASLSLATKRAPALITCEPESLQHAILSAAADNLLVDGNEAVILPYKDKKSKKVIANYQPMVHGLIKRMKEFGAVFSISCDVVREKDTFEANHADLGNLKHSYPLNMNDNERGEIIAAYALFRDENGRVIHPELMNKSQLEKVKSESKFNGEGSIWDKWEEEMKKKSVIRRGFKRIPTDNGKLLDLMHRMDTLFDMKDVTPAEPERQDPFSPQIEQSNSNDAPHASQSSSQGANTSPEQPAEPAMPPLAPGKAQEMSNYLWKSPRNLTELNIDLQQFQTDHIIGHSYDDKMKQKLAAIRDIHRVRVSGADHRKSDETAIIELANLQIECEEPEDV